MIGEPFLCMAHLATQSIMVVYRDVHHCNFCGYPSDPLCDEANDVP